MPRKQKPREVTKSTKKIRKILDYATEMDSMRDQIQELIVGHLRIHNISSWDAIVHVQVATIGATIGRRDYSYNIRFTISGAIPMTIQELAEVDLDSTGFKVHGPLHKRGRTVHSIGIECNTDNIESKTESAYTELIDWIKSNHIRLSRPLTISIER